MASEQGKWRKVLIDAAGISVIALVLSLFMQCDVSSLSFLNSAERYLDFHSADFYQLVANARHERTLEDQVAIVRIDSLSREEIAQLIDDISLCQPAAIGLDVNFVHTTDRDTFLQHILSSTPSLVLPMGVEREEENESGKWEVMNSYLFDSLALSCRGVTNLNIHVPYQVVRTFIPYYETDRGSVPNFAVALAAKAHPESVVRLQEQMQGEQQPGIAIHYGSREYDVFAPAEVLEHPDALTGKVVLVGAIGELADTHITPIDPNMSGVMIHAHTLSTVLHGTYPTSLPRWATVLLGLMLSLLLVAATDLTLDLQAGNLIIRIFQFILLVLLVLLGCWLYLSFRLVVELAYPLTLIALGLFLLDVWNGVLSLVSTLKQRIHTKHNR